GVVVVDGGPVVDVLVAPGVDADAGGDVDGGFDFQFGLVGHHAAVEADGHVARVAEEAVGDVVDDFLGQFLVVFGLVVFGFGLGRELGRQGGGDLSGAGGGLDGRDGAFGDVGAGQDQAFPFFAAGRSRPDALAQVGGGVDVPAVVGHEFFGHQVVAAGAHGLLGVGQVGAEGEAGLALLRLGGPEGTADAAV